MAQLFSVLVNGVVFKEDSVLVSQRSWDEPHEPGKWTIPGGKVEYTDELFDILGRDMAREIKEEVGVEVHSHSFRYVTSNCFQRSDKSLVLAVVLACDYKAGDPQPLDDTIDVKWVDEKSIHQLEFPPNVKEYVLEAFKYRKTIGFEEG